MYKMLGAARFNRDLDLDYLYFNLWISFSIRPPPPPLTNTLKECPDKHTHFFVIILHMNP